MQGPILHPHSPADKGHHQQSGRRLAPLVHCRIMVEGFSVCLMNAPRPLLNTLQPCSSPRPSFPLLPSIKPPVSILISNSSADSSSLRRSACDSCPSGSGSLPLLRSHRPKTAVGRTGQSYWRCPPSASWDRGWPKTRPARLSSTSPNPRRSSSQLLCNELFEQSHQFCT